MECVSAISKRGVPWRKPRSEGYRKLGDLIEATELFEVKRQDKIVVIRDKRKS